MFDAFADVGGGDGPLMSDDDRPICEFCSELYDGEPVPYPDPDSKFANNTFCSDDCAQEAYEDAMVWEQRDRMNYECYGNDFDSWE